MYSPTSLISNLNKENEPEGKIAQREKHPNTSLSKHCLPARHAGLPREIKEWRVLETIIFFISVSW